MKRRDFLKLGIAAPLVAVGIAKAPRLPQGGYLVPEEYVDDLLALKRREIVARFNVPPTHVNCRCWVESCQP